MSIDFRESGRVREKERNIDVINIDWLSSVCSLMGDQTNNLLVYRSILQPTEPPGQGFLTFYSLFLVPAFSNYP